jgi:hypothetical protein
MKNKHVALASLILLVLGFCGAIGFSQVARLDSNHRLRFAPLKPVPVISVPSEAEMTEMRRAEKTMHAVARPSRTDTKPVNLAAMGFKVENKKPSLEVAKRPVVRNDFFYDITFAFISGRQRFCIIDGSFYSEGSRLPGGASVEAIETKRVLIKKEQRKKWIPLAETMPKTG